MTLSKFFLSAGGVLLGALLLQGCSHAPIRYADTLADMAALQPEEVASGPFTLTTYSRIQDINAPVTIYIEGDIQGWAPTTEPGVDPTPDLLQGLRLATLDPSPNVVYIARPCQFAVQEDTSCEPRAWAHGRHAELIVSSMNRVVDHFVVPFLHPQINLVGYSGGGAIAALIAARRHDVSSLRTIAGNLDPAATSRHHASDMDEDFLDPMMIAKRLPLIAQQHYVGTADHVVPPFLIANFVKAEGPSYCIKTASIAGATHNTGWELAWQARAADIPVCGTLRD